MEVAPESEVNSLLSQKNGVQDLRSSLLDLDDADFDILQLQPEVQPISGGREDAHCITSLQSGPKLSSMGDSCAGTLSELIISEDIEADVDLMPSPVPEVRQPRGSKRQATSFNARRQSVAIAKNFDLAVAEDGLLGEDEMSQLSGRTLDLRNSAALLKLARMSVDATALQDKGIRAHRPQQLELAQSAQSADGAREPDLAGAPPPIQAESPRLGAGRPPRARGPSSQHALSRSGLDFPLQADQPGLRASMARPKQVPRMLASISEDRVTGLGAEEPGMESPLATTRVYPDRGRSTFSPPDTLRDSMALFLQLEGAVDERSPFKPGDVLQMHAERQAPADAGPAVAEPAASSLAPEAPAPKAVEQQPAAASSRPAGVKVAVRARQPAASALRKPTVLTSKTGPAERAGGQAGPPSRAAADARGTAAPQSALQRIHQRVSDAAAKARKLPGIRRPANTAVGSTAAPANAAGNSRTTAASDSRRAAGEARTGPARSLVTRGGRIPAAPRGGNASSAKVSAGAAHERVSDQAAGRAALGPLAAGRLHASSGTQAPRPKAVARAEGVENPPAPAPSRLPSSQHRTPPPPQASPGFLRMLEEALHAEEHGKPFGGTGRGLRNSPAEGKDDRAPARLTAAQRHALEYRDD